MIELLRPDDELFPRRDVISLQELIHLDESEYAGSGPRTSEKVIWLGSAIETTEFWDELTAHIYEGKRVKHSIGGIFYGENGAQPIGDYTWNEVYTSADHFLAKFGSRATEYLFRDFTPQNQSRPFNRHVQAARIAALDQAPRLRRLYKEDYEEAFTTIDLWSGMNKDLANIREPQSTNEFFDNGKVTRRGKSDVVNIRTHLEKSMVRRFIRQVGSLTERAQFIDYRNLSQLIRDYFNMDPRSFFLQINSDEFDPELRELILEVQSQIETKIKEVAPPNPEIIQISKGELKEIIHTSEFWETLVEDLDQSASSANSAYSFHYFLRNYDRDLNDIVPNKIGDYATYCTAFEKRTTGRAMARIQKLSQELSSYLMWEVKSTEDTRETILDAKRLASEFFQNDCLYVELQLPEFWQRLQSDMNKLTATPSFMSFLRYFNSANPTANPTSHKPGDARYQRFFHRSYHEPEDLIQLCKTLGLPICDDFKENLRALFLHLAPEDLLSELKDIFPTDFDPEIRTVFLSNKAIEQEQLDEATAYLESIIDGQGLSDSRSFETIEDAQTYRKKIASAARRLQLPIRTELQGTVLSITIKDRKKLSPEEVLTLEESITLLRNEGNPNRIIALKLGISEPQVEHMVGRLIKRGVLKKRY